MPPRTPASMSSIGRLETRTRGRVRGEASGSMAHSDLKAAHASRTGAPCSARSAQLGRRVARIFHARLGRVPLKASRPDSSVHSRRGMGGDGSWQPCSLCWSLRPCCRRACPAARPVRHRPVLWPNWLPTRRRPVRLQPPRRRRMRLPRTHPALPGPDPDGRTHEAPRRRWPSRRFTGSTRSWPWATR